MMKKAFAIWLLAGLPALAGSVSATRAWVSNRVEEARVEWKGDVAAATNPVPSLISAAEGRAAAELASATNGLPERIASVTNGLPERIASVTNGLPERIAAVTNGLPERIDGLAAGMNAATGGLWSAVGDVRDELVSATNTLRGAIEDISGAAADLGEYAKTNDIPVRTSQLINDSGFVTNFADTADLAKASGVFPDWSSKAPDLWATGEFCTWKGLTYMRSGEGDGSTAPDISPVSWIRSSVGEAIARAQPDLTALTNGLPGMVAAVTNGLPGMIASATNGLPEKIVSATNGIVERATSAALSAVEGLDAKTAFRLTAPPPYDQRWIDGTGVVWEAHAAPMISSNGVPWVKLYGGGVYPTAEESLSDSEVAWSNGTANVASWAKDLLVDINGAEHSFPADDGHRVLFSKTLSFSEIDPNPKWMAYGYEQTLDSYLWGWTSANLQVIYASPDLASGLTDTDLHFATAVVQSVSQVFIARLVSATVGETAVTVTVNVTGFPIYTLPEGITRTVVLPRVARFNMETQPAAVDALARRSDTVDTNAVRSIAIEAVTEPVSPGFYGEKYAWYDCVSGAMLYYDGSTGHYRSDASPYRLFLNMVEDPDGDGVGDTEVWDVILPGGSSITAGHIAVDDEAAVLDEAYDPDASTDDPTLQFVRTPVPMKNVSGAITERSMTQLLPAGPWVAYTNGVQYLVVTGLVSHSFRIRREYYYGTMSWNLYLTDAGYSLTDFKDTPVDATEISWSPTEWAYGNPGDEGDNVTLTLRRAATNIYGVVTQAELRNTLADFTPAKSGGGGDTFAKLTVGTRVAAGAVGAASTALGRANVASGDNSFVSGDNSVASQWASEAHGMIAHSTNRYAYVWNGDPNHHYGSHGIGTYNVNPLHGIYGFYVGDQTFVEALSGIFAQTSPTNIPCFDEEGNCVGTNTVSPCTILRDTVAKVATNVLYDTRNEPVGDWVCTDDDMGEYTVYKMYWENGTWYATFLHASPHTGSLDIQIQASGAGAADATSVTVNFDGAFDLHLEKRGVKPSGIALWDFKAREEWEVLLPGNKFASGMSEWFDIETNTWDMLEGPVIDVGSYGVRQGFLLADFADPRLVRSPFSTVSEVAHTNVVDGYITVKSGGGYNNTNIIWHVIATKRSVNALGLARFSDLDKYAVPRQKLSYEVRRAVNLATDYIWDPLDEVCYRRQMLGGFIDYVAVTNIDVTAPENWQALEYLEEQRRNQR